MRGGCRVVCLVGMATKKKAETKAEKTEQPAQPETAAGEEPILQKTAKAIGSAIGKAAVKTGIVHPTPKPKKGKLVKKAKTRLPRKAKKQAKKKLLGTAG
jgi:hypothetical protein